MEKETTQDNTDRFSWKRVGAVARYYSPVTRRACWLLPLLSLCIYLVSLICYATDSPMLMRYFVGWITYVIIFSPAFFASQHGRETEITLPAKNSEKYVYYLLFCYVVVPVITMLPLEILLNLTTNYDVAMNAELMKNVNFAKAALKFSTGEMYLYTYLTTVSMTSVGLYSVMASRRRRLLKAFLLPLAVQFAIGFVIGMMGSIMGIKAAISGLNPDQVASNITDVVLVSTYASMTIFVLLFIVCTYLTWRRVCDRQA
ncbi:MAG: hypothetical protein UHP27_03405 [Muribaculaceae bacterium]|nr:hypothetical protein [Muribaculaceae bacterium]